MYFAFIGEPLLQGRKVSYVGTIAAMALALAIILFGGSGCLITSQRVAGRRAAIRVAPSVVNGAPGVGLVVGGPGAEWTRGEKIAGAVETAGWIGIAAALYEINRKAESGRDREPSPTIVQHTVSGNNVLIIGNTGGSVSTRRDEQGK